MRAPRWLDPRRTFGLRLTIIIVSLLLLILAAATLVTLRVARASLTDQAGDYFQGHAESLSELVQLYLTTNVNEVQQLATDQELVSAAAKRNATYQGTSENILAQLLELDEQWRSAVSDDPLVQSVVVTGSNEEDVAAQPVAASAGHTLSEFHDLFEEHSQVFLTDRYGGTVSSTGRLSDFYQGDEDWWQTAWNDGAGAVYVSNPEYDVSAGVMALLIAVPVVDEDGDIAGILRSTLSIDELYALLASTTFGKTGYAALLGSDGTQFFDPGVGTNRALSLLPADMLEHITEPDGSFLTGAGAIFGHQSLAMSPPLFENATETERAAADAVARLGWQVIIRQDASEALSTLKLIERVAWVSGGVAILIGAVAAFFISQAVTRPLTRLAVAARDVGAGKLDTPLPQPGLDEIGGLTDAFHTMTEQLRRMIGALKKRTDELSQANASLLKEVQERGRAEDALHESDRRHRWLIESAPDPMLIVDEDGRITIVNTATERLFGYEREELIGATVEQLIPAHLEGVHAAHRASYGAHARRRNMSASTNERLGRRKDGSLFPAEISLSPLQTADGMLVTAAVRDITQRKRAEEALRESEERYRDYYENAPNAYFALSPETGVIIECNQTATDMLGIGKSQVIGQPIAKFYTADSLEIAQETKDLFFAQGYVSGVELRIQSNDGSIIDVNLDATAIRDADGSIIRSRSVWRDITDRKRAERALMERKDQLEIHTREIEYVNMHLAETQEALERSLEAERQRARTDPLTGVLNHAAIVDELRALLSVQDDSSTHAVAMVDLDGLKAVNDTFGHQTGDEVLVAVADVLAREGATVGRYGGDEFVVILPGKQREEAEHYQDDVTIDLQSRRVEDPESGATIPVKISIGLAIFPEEANTVTDIIALSDSAMYAVKRQRAMAQGGLTSREDERASRMVGQIVPLLTSPGDLSEKLNRAAKRLSAANGYDAVDVSFYAPEPGTPLGQQAFAQVDENLVAEWTAERNRDSSDAHPMRLVLERTRRPVMIEDMASDERIPEQERKLLIAGGIQSGMVVPMIWQDRIVGSLAAGSKRLAAFTPRDAQYLTTVATQITAIMRMETLVADLQAATEELGHAQEETVLLLAAAAEAHDHTTGLHLQSVRSLAEALAREMGSDEEEARTLGLAAVLHDIGKIRVPDAILASPGKLAPDQWDVMRRHTIWGASFLSGHEGFELATKIARSHHERWDGDGYPDGLSGSGIPEGASVVTVADAFDAMTHDRPYRSSQPVDEAIKEIAKHAGTQFNPAAVAALERLYRRNELPVAHPDTSLEDAA